MPQTHIRILLNHKDLKSRKNLLNGNKIIFGCLYIDSRVKSCFTTIVGRIFIFDHFYNFSWCVYVTCQKYNSTYVVSRHGNLSSHRENAISLRHVQFTQVQQSQRSSFILAGPSSNLYIFYLCTYIVNNFYKKDS